MVLKSVMSLAFVLTALCGCANNAHSLPDCQKFAQDDQARFESVREYIPAIDTYIQTTRGWKSTDYYISSDGETDQERIFVVNYRPQERCVGKYIYSGPDGRSFVISINKLDNALTENGLTQ